MNTELKKDDNGLFYTQTSYGKVYETIPKERIYDGFHNYSNKQNY